MPPDIFYVYLKFDLNGVPRYVGKGHGKRAFYHEGFAKHHNWQIDALVKKARATGRELPTVFLAENLSETEAFRLEVIWIKTIGRQNVGGPLYNWTDGGEGVSGHRHSEDTKAKMRGPKSPAHVANMTGWQLRVSEEQLTQMKAKQRAAKLGKPMAEETKAKIRAGNLGKLRTPAQCAAISAGKLGHEVSAETRRKISETKLLRSRQQEESRP